MNQTYFDDKVKVAEVIVSGGRGITSRDGFALNFSRDGDVLSWRKTEGILGIRKTKAIESGVMGDGDLFGEREFAPFFWAENRLAT